MKKTYASVMGSSSNKNAISKKELLKIVDPLESKVKASYICAIRAILLNSLKNTKAMTLDEILKKYKEIQIAPFDPFSNTKLFDSVLHGTKRYKNQLIKILETKICKQESQDLEFYLALAHRDGMDEAYKPILKQLVLAKWHDYHEDVVDYIRELKDDDFTDDLFTVAITPEPYRQYDDELEATLRKCVHALKAINSKKANERLEQLGALGNENVQFALEMYH